MSLIEEQNGIITRHNKLIAEFMGGTESKDGVFSVCGKFGIERILTMNLEYHTSWDWLMPVVEKIENLEYIDRMGRFHFNAINFEENYTCVVTDKEEYFTQVEGETKIDATYLSVVEFIKWYNEQK